MIITYIEGKGPMQFVAQVHDGELRGWTLSDSSDSEDKEDGKFKQ